MSELKPCPFCPGKATVREWDSFGKYVRCSECKACGAVKPDEQQAIAAWNNRSQPNEPLTMEQLKQMYGEPVWIQFGDETSCVVILRIGDEYTEYFYFGNEVEDWLPTELYGETWFVYRHKPQQEEQP